ncbi:MAG: hypothetical protein IRY94_11350, partial [Rhodospirillaceae bacterium]|nr:hypothetical protein [Rhodospirillaceae bacterium]
MTLATLRVPDKDASAHRPRLTPGTGAPGVPVVFALDLGQRTGWALCGRDRAITSGTVEFRPGRFEGGGLAWLRFKAWLEDVRQAAGDLDL